MGPVPFGGMSARVGQWRGAPDQPGLVAFGVANALACGLLGFAGAVSTRLTVVAVVGYLFAAGCVGLAGALVVLPKHRRRLNRWAVIALLPGGILIVVGALTPPDRPGHQGCVPDDPRPLCRSSSSG
jgi:hypothetical protein